MARAAATEKKSHPRGRRIVAPRESSPARAVAPNRRAARYSGWLIGVGASAGGLEALTAFLHPLPTGLRAAIVIVQHMSHTHPSLLVQLLARETRLEVVQIVDGMRPKPGVVHIAPPRMNVELTKAGFKLSEPAAARLPTPSVDAFFRSIAETCGERAVGVVLSGTGSDGAAGLVAIRRGGGHAYAQDPGSARYDGMPTASIEAGIVEGVLSADKLGEQMIALIRTGAPVPSALAAGIESPLLILFRRVNRRTGIDLEGYKETTLKRRLNRRLVATRSDQLDDYLEYIDSNPEEIDHLLQELLISVTGFFRDKSSFTVLESRLARLIAAKPADDDIRVWVAGCATGEEAYSITILILDALRKLHRVSNVRVFATDIDMPALQKARRGAYPASALAKVEPDCVERYFDPVGPNYEVKAFVRDCVKFARHDITADAPFLRSDLVSCRNLLIYFQPHLQARVIASLNYALAPGGMLFIGKSESVGPFEEFFELIDKGAHLYRSLGRRNLPLPKPVNGHALNGLRRHRTHEEELAAEHVAVLLGQYAPASVLVTGEGEIVHALGKINSYLVFPSGRPVLNLAKVVRAELRSELSMLMHRAARDRGRVKGSVHLGERENDAYRMSVEPISVAGSALFMVVFESVDRTAPGGVPADALAANDPDNPVHSELIATRENLQTVIEELETQNEEMQALNEELQSTNEELETSNEELQSTNEELTTVNDEVARKSEEVAFVNADLLSLLESLPHPVIVFDDALRVMRCNSNAKRMFGIPPLEDAALDVMALPAAFAGVPACLKEAIASRKAAELKIEFDGRHFKLLISPCKLPSRDAPGAVMHLVDITVIAVAQQKLAIGQARLTMVFEDSSMAVMIVDPLGNVEFVNKRALDWLGATHAEVIGAPLWQKFSAQTADALKRRHISVLAANQTLESDDTIQSVGENLIVHSLWIPVRDHEGRPTGVCWKALDMTERIKAARALEMSEALNRAVLTAMPAIISVLDRDGVILSVNEGWRRFAIENGGTQSDGWVGHSYLKFCATDGPEKDDGDQAEAGIREVLAGRCDMYTQEYPCHGAGQQRWFRMYAVPLGAADGGAVVMHVDITAIRVAKARLEEVNDTLEHAVTARTRELRQAVDELEMFSHTVSHDLRSPLRTLVGFSDLLKSEAADKLNSESRVYLDRIALAAQRMSGYLDELLKLSNLTRGELLISDVDVSTMAREIGADLQLRYPGRRVELRVADGLTLRGDANLLRAVFENLLGNAWKYTRPRDPARIEVDRTVRAGRPTIYVRDNGIGFDMSYRSKLFMPFQRLHSGTEYEGSGLGLAAAWRIVVRHGGTLDAEAWPDIGATFYVNLL